MRPIEEAEQLWSKSEPTILFQDRLSYVSQKENGFVHISPYSFVMASALSFKDKEAWFIEMAVGNVYELVRTFPCSLPFIAFCRGCKGDKRSHIYPAQRFLRKCNSYLFRDCHPC